MIGKKTEINQVFTPRMHEVNPTMYVARPDLEKQLERSVNKNTHSILFGESGNGKSWLYKKVLGKLGVPYLVVNCGVIAQTGSIVGQIATIAIGPNSPTKIGYQETKNADVNAIVAKASISHIGEYQLTQEEPIFRAFSALADKSGRKTILVFENLESIFKNIALMEELANMLLLLDDERYAQFKINFLIVGTPNGVLDYFSRTKNLESVANRLEELPRVPGLSFNQVRQLTATGFEQLNIKVEENLLNLIFFHVHEITLGVAQRVHEYLECLAYLIEDNSGKYEPSLLDTADNKWLLKGLKQAYSVVDGHLNSREAQVARKNQVIFAIGKASGHSFDRSSIEEFIEREFPSTVREAMGVGSILTTLSSGDSPLLTRLSKGKDFCIADPRYLMCIRLILRKDKGGKVTKRRFDARTA
jgi:hypothetical protein